MAKLEEQRLQWLYDNVEFSLDNDTTNYDVKTNQATAFNNINIATDVSIRTDKTITTRFNSTTNPAITVTSSDSPFNFDSLRVTNIYLTNSSGSAANIKIFMIGRKSP